MNAWADRCGLGKGRAMEADSVGNAVLKCQLVLPGWIHAHSTKRRRTKVTDRRPGGPNQGDGLSCPALLWTGLGWA
eukprot:COSAG02_NODE_34_length_49821_cov_105.420438_5_plen_76_part_00